MAEVKITTNEFTNVKDIRGKYLYSKDNYVYVYLRIFSYNIDLLSEEELRTITRSMAASFGDIRRDFVYYTLPREVDLDRYKAFLDDRYRQELSHVGKRKVLGERIAEAKALTMSGKYYEHQHFIRLWQKIERGGIQEAETILSEALESFRKIFSGAGIKTKVCYQDEILKMCNLYAAGTQSTYDTVGNTVHEPYPKVW